MVGQILGPNIVRKIQSFGCFICIGALLFLMAPVIVMKFFDKFIDEVNPF